MPKAKAGTVATATAVAVRPRYKSGNPKPEPSGAKSPALVKRIMDHAVKLGADARVGTVLGRMYLEGLLTEAECEAGYLYAEVVGRYERLKGRPRRTAKSPSYDAGFGDTSLDLDALRRMDPERADRLEKKIKRQVKAAQNLYQRCQDNIFANPEKGGRIVNATLVDQVCCHDEMIHSVHHASFKALLRNLADKVFFLKDPQPSQAPKRAKAQPADAKLLAAAAVDALDAWFTSRGATIYYYRLARAQAWQPRGISAFGANRAGTELHYTVKVPRRGLLGAAIDAALVKAAVAKGWADTPVIRRSA